ncbi:hypothetical protein [Synechococcus phage DSL-LC02]|nr:hypothetical protein [Synechococcus phage DSL-LC02]
MAESGTSKYIKDKINERIKSNNDQKEFFTEKIIVIDNEKTPLDSAIKSIDKVVFDDVTNVNNKLQEVKSAYAARITAGCRSNLYWRQTGISTASSGSNYYYVVTQTCTKTSPNQGFTTATYISSAPNGISTDSSGLFGMQSENLYGIRFYDEPYTEDVTNSFVAGFIGTVGTGSTIVTALTSYDGKSLSSIKVGQLLICKKNGVFNTENNEIVGIGTTIANLSVISAGLSTNAVVYTVTVESNAVASASAPESDGSFVEFQVLKSADEVGNFAITFGKNPYSPQSIGIMSSSNLGTGVKVEYTNSGYPPATQSWRPELEGYGDNVKPNVSAGKIYYDVAFTVKPQKLVSGNWVDASEGDVGYLYLYGDVMPPLADTARVTNLGSCATEETALTNAIAAADAAETAIASGISTVNTRLQIATALREERNNLNIQIWGQRQLLGKLNEEISIGNSIKTYLDDPTVLGIIT